MNTIVLKQVHPDDWEKIRHIAYATWPATFGELIPHEQLTYMLATIYNEHSLRKQMAAGHQFLLAYAHNEPAGFVSYELGYNKQQQLMIHKLYILPAMQGLGIGKKILEHLTDIARKAGDRALRLKVFFKNKKAIDFYERTGFRTAGEETTDPGNGYRIRDYVLIKDLA